MTDFTEIEKRLRLLKPKELPAGMKSRCLSEGRRFSFFPYLKMAAAILLLSLTGISVLQDMQLRRLVETQPNAVFSQADDSSGLPFFPEMQRYWKITRPYLPSGQSPNEETLFSWRSMYAKHD